MDLKFFGWEKTPHKKRATKSKKKWGIERKYICHMAEYNTVRSFFNWLDGTWRIYKWYPTKAQRDQALETLNKNHKNYEDKGYNAFTQEFRPINR